MKILQVFNFLSMPHGGGTVDILYHLSKILAERGHSVTICTGDYELDQDYLNILTKVDIRLHSSFFNQHGIFIMPGLLKFDIRPYDVIHLHCYRSYQNTMICGKAIRHRVPYIIDAHGSTVDLPGPKRLLRRVYDLVFGLSTLGYAKTVIAETEIGVAEYRRLGVDVDKIRLLHPLLDTSEFLSLPERSIFRSKYGIGSRFMVLFVGRIHSTKGIDILVEAVARIIAKGINAYLVVMGQDDSYKSTLVRLIAERGIRDRVLFTGFLTGTDKLSAIVDADVLVQPSKNEAGARPSLEAILCGTPVIVSADTGAGKEIASFDGGVLFDNTDIDFLVSALIYVANNTAVVKEKTVRAREYIENNLSLDKQVSRYEELYREAIA